MLTRAEMEQVIKDGGSVMYGGRVLNRAEHLPSEAELAQGNPAAEAAAESNLMAEADRISQQLQLLQSRQAPPAKQGETAPPAEQPRARRSRDES